MNNPTILVAEDDPAVRQGVVDALSFSGYQVMAAQDGRQAMNYALSTQYHLLLLDLVMPHHSGFEVLEALKRNRPGQPVIILSARGEEADRVKGLKMGADDYIVKPFSLKSKNLILAQGKQASLEEKFSTQMTAVRKISQIKKLSYSITLFLTLDEPLHVMKFSAKYGT